MKGAARHPGFFFGATIEPLSKGIHDKHAVVALSFIQVFTVDRVATHLLRGRQDRSVSVADLRSFVQPYRGSKQFGRQGLGRERHLGLDPQCKGWRGMQCLPRGATLVNGCNACQKWVSPCHAATLYLHPGLALSINPSAWRMSLNRSRTSLPHARRR
jgi:hypothetical protein